MNTPIGENEELKYHRVNTGGFRADAEAESVNDLLESEEMSEVNQITNHSAMSKEHKV